VLTGGGSTRDEGNPDLGFWDVFRSFKCMLKDCVMSLDRRKQRHQAPLESGVAAAAGFAVGKPDI
jgi:hypothetical protein